MKLNWLSARSAHYEEQIMRWKSLAEDVRFADEAEFNIAGVLLDIVPIHADLLSANIMYDEQSKDVRFIDYEYAQLGPAGLDLANHFNAVPEGMLIQDGCLDVKRYPSAEIRRHFLKAYLEGLDKDDPDLTSD